LTYIFNIFFQVGLTFKDHTDYITCSRVQIERSI